MVGVYLQSLSDRDWILECGLFCNHPLFYSGQWRADSIQEWQRPAESINIKIKFAKAGTWICMHSVRALALTI